MIFQFKVLLPSGCQGLSTQESKKTCFQKDAKSEANKNCLTLCNFQIAGDTVKVITPNKRARREL